MTRFVIAEDLYWGKEVVIPAAALSFKKRFRYLRDRHEDHKDELMAMDNSFRTLPIKEMTYRDLVTEAKQYDPDVKGNAPRRELEALVREKRDELNKKRAKAKQELALKSIR